VESLGCTSICISISRECLILSYDRKSVGSVFPGIGEEKGIAYDHGHRACTKHFPASSIVLGIEHKDGVNVT